MVSQLTSVRFDDSLLEDARLLADAHDTSVAEVIRQAVKEYVGRRLAEADVIHRVEAEHARRMKRLKAYADDSSGSEATRHHR